MPSTHTENDMEPATPYLDSAVCWDHGIVDELTYRMYAHNRREYGVRPQSCYQLWGQTVVQAMEARYQSELRK